MNSKKQSLLCNAFAPCSTAANTLMKNREKAIFPSHMARMEASAYDHAFRQEVLKSDMSADDEIQKMETEGK